MDWAVFLDARMESMRLEQELGLTSPAAASSSRCGTAVAPPRSQALKLETRKLAAANKQVELAVAEARARAARLEAPRNLLEFTLASFSDDEVTPANPLQGRLRQGCEHQHAQFLGLDT